MFTMRPPLRRIAAAFCVTLNVPVKIHAQHAFEFFQRQFLDRAIADDAGVVDQDVEAAETFADLFHHRFGLLRICHIAFDDERLFQFRRNVFRVRFVLPLLIGDVVNDALRAASAERLNHFRAEPARAAGDEHDFAGKIERISHGPDVRRNARCRTSDSR